MLNVHVGRTREEAFAAARDGHDEFVRFLAPYGRFTGYLGPDGSKCPSASAHARGFGRSADHGHRLGRRRRRRHRDCRELLDLQHLCVFLDLPGLSRQAIDTQLELVATEVMPRLGVTLEPRPLPGRAL